jgi:hypothetical protein
MLRWSIAALAGAVIALAWVRVHAQSRLGQLRAVLAAARTPDRFRPDMVAGLPEPARRYLVHAIAPGTPLASSVELVLSGTIRLTPDGSPLPTSSRETLAPPRGFVWSARTRMGPVPVSGFDQYVDERGEMRWWAAGLIPVVRARGADVSRSAAGRLAGEAIFVPSVLLTQGTGWEALDDHRARVHLSVAGEDVAITLEMDEQGRLLRSEFPRWNGDPRNGPVGYLTFVSDGFEAERTFGGVTIPTRFRAGWRLGEPGAFPFFHATIEDASYR